MLTYIDLAYFDDLLVDCFVDRIHYWATTRKVREYKPIRGVPQALLLDIIREDVARKSPALNTAVERFVGVPSVRNFLGRFQDPAVRNEFERHVKRYVSIFVPECGFGVEVTDRYVARSQTVEACVVARRVYQPGEEIKYLVGFLAHLTDADEEQLNRSNGKDFSIINSSRRGVNCMMLGPARFVNHDCDANARFSSSGRCMAIFAKRKICIGEEITVEYSQNYFGKRNRECLCATCEGKGVNGFDLNKPEEDSESSDEDVVEIKNLRRAKRPTNANSSTANSSTSPSNANSSTSPSNANLPSTNPSNPNFSSDPSSNSSNMPNASPLSPVNVNGSPLSPVNVNAIPNEGTDLTNRVQARLLENRHLVVQKLHTLEHDDTDDIDDDESVSSKMSDSLLSSRQASSIPSPSTSIEPETEDPLEDKQGRSLRPRRSAGPPNGSYKLSTMIKRKLVVAPEMSRDAIMRQVSKFHKTYFRTPYEPQHEKKAQTCWNCHVKFLPVAEDKKITMQRLLRKHCPRCHRHIILYHALWPSRRKQEEPIELYYDPIFERPPELKDEEEENQPKPKRPYRKREVPKKKWTPLPAVVDEPKKSKRPRRLSVWLKKRRREERSAAADAMPTKRSKSVPN